MVYYIVNILAILLNGAFVVGFFTALNMGVPVVAEVQKNLPFLPEKYVILFLSSLVMGVFVVIGLSPAVDLVMRWIKGYRDMLRDEKELFNPAFRDVMDRVGWNGINDYSTYVVDEIGIASDHLGMNSFAVSRKLLKELMPDEIKAAVCHEVGHLKLGHGVQVRVFFTVSILGQIALWFTQRILMFLWNLYGLEIPLISQFGMLGYGVFNIVKCAIQILLVLPLLVGAVIGFRENEYATDRFVIDMGFGEGLHSYLLKMLDDEIMVQQDGKFMRWIKRLIWPSVGKRLAEVEKYQSLCD